MPAIDVRSLGYDSHPQLIMSDTRCVTVLNGCELGYETEDGYGLHLLSQPSSSNRSTDSDVELDLLP